MIATVLEILTSFTSRMTDDIAFMCLHAWPLAMTSHAVDIGTIEPLDHVRVRLPSVRVYVC